MKSVTTSYSDEFVAAVVEIARIFGEKADFGAIVEKAVGDQLLAIVHDPETLLDNIAEGHAWETQLEAASVAERAVKKINLGLRYDVVPKAGSPGRWAVRFKKG